MAKKTKTGAALARSLIFPMVLIAFPLFLLHISLSSYFNLQIKIHREKDSFRSRQALLKVKEYADGRRFFDLLLENYFRNLPENLTLKEGLQQRISQLKKAFPNSFSFIVWDEKGKLDKKLTDNPSFVVFLNRLNRLLADLQELTLKFFPSQIRIPRELVRKTRSFRRLLGPFIPAGKIAESFIPTDQRKCFQMHAKGAGAFGWYRKRRTFSVFAYISYEAVKSKIGARQLCQRVNQNSQQLQLFLIDLENSRTFPELSSDETNEILLYHEKLEKLHPPELLESSEAMYSFQAIESGWSAVAISDKALIKRLAKKPDLYLFRIAALFLALFFLLRFLFLLYGNPFSSIRFKLLIVFAYTVAVPLMIFSTVGFEYVSQKMRRSEIEAGANLFQFLNNIDQEFGNFLQMKAEKISQFIDSFVDSSPSEKIELEQWNEFAGELERKFHFSALNIFDKEGRDLFEKRFSHGFLDVAFPRALAVDILEFLNDRGLEEYKQDKAVTRGGLLSFENTRKNIEPMGLIDRKFFFYNADIRIKTKLRADFFIQIYWDLRRLQLEFYNVNLNRMVENSPMGLVWFFPDTGAVFPEKQYSHELAIFLKNVNLHGEQSGVAKIGSRDYLVSGLRGNNLLDVVMAAKLDFTELNDQNLELLHGILRILTMSMFFSMSLYLVLSHQILLPIRKLSLGVEKVRELDFKYRINLDSSNEFGRLAKSIDHTLENLQELEIARVVQEALLPEKNINTDFWQVIGSTKTMTRLGGDYFDFFSDKNENLSVFIADAAGHGVQAALMMAMAKSVILLEDLEDEIGLLVMKNLNHTFCQLRKASIKTMMTGQFLRFTRQGCSLINAGHCFPLIVSSDGKEIREVKQTSLPLGFSQNRKFSQCEFEFYPGETLILYTDGIIESINDNGKSLEMQGFFNLIKESFSQDLESFQLALVQNALAWQPEQKDDLTMVFIRLKQ